MSKKFNDKETTNDRSKSPNNSRKRRSNKRYESKSAKGNSRNDRPDGQLHSNDPSWWNKTGQFAKDASSFSFNNAIGARLPGFEKSVDWFSPSGIMRIDYVPSLGTVKGPADPVNVAARLMYDVINAKNSRNSSYDPADLMTYIIAVANAWSLHAWLKRAIGLMLTFSPTNRYIPDALLQAMGIAPISAQNDIVTWRNIANRLALRLNMLAVPKGIDYFKRAIFMNTGIYADDPSSKASLMFFNPKAILALREPDESHDACWLSYEKLEVDKEGGLTPTDVETLINTIVYPLFNSTDIAVMSSDIIKAYGLENCFTLPAITETEITLPEFNPAVLLQINNARVLPVLDALYTDYKVTQDMTYNCLIATLPFTCSVTGWIGSIKSLRIPVNMPMEHPTNDDMLEATRLMFGFSTTNKSVIDPVCTELVIDTKIFKFAYDAVADTWCLSSKSVNPSYIYTKDQISDFVDDLADYNKFHAAPLFHAYRVTSANTPNQIEQHRCMSDIQNYTTIADAELRTLHEASLLSIFSPLGN